MKVLVNAGFGSPVGDKTLGLISSLGFHGVRQELPFWEVPAKLVIEELSDYEELLPILLFPGGDGAGLSGLQVLDRWRVFLTLIAQFGLSDASPGPLIEIGNEFDISPEWRDKPEEAAMLAVEVWKDSRKLCPQVTVLLPSVSNLNKRGLSYLKKMLDVGLPAELQVAVHRYPPDISWNSAHSGFSSRLEELEVLHALLGKRKFWVTETGRTEGPVKVRKPFPLCFLYDRIMLSEWKVAHWAERELLFWKEAGAQGVSWYQIGDGPSENDPLDHYGIINREGEIKRVGKTISELIMSGQLD